MTDTHVLHFDLIVIGFGKAGKTIAMERGRAGDRVAIVERSPAMYGGTCINIGCIPTKSLLYSTDEGIDWQESVTTRDELIEALNRANLGMAQEAGVTVIDAEARFTGPRQLSLSVAGVADGGDTVLDAERLVINTGAVTDLPPIPGVDGPRVHDSTSIQHVSPLPARLAIIGTGPVGLEFASLFSGQGSEVTVIGSSEPFAAYDESVAEEARALLEARGVRFLTGARAQRLEDADTHVTVTYAREGVDGHLGADAVLLATGRAPATDGLGLEAAGVETGERGEVCVDEQLRTSAEGVWAVGDVHGGPQQTYLSYDDYRVLSSQFSGDGTYTTAGRTFPTTIFTSPPLSHIGLTAREAGEQGLDVTVTSAKVADMPIVPRPKILGQPEGLAQFVVDSGTDAILGATLLMSDSQELINTVALGMRHGVSASELGRGIYTHPSSSEVFNQLLGP
ncbi:FAD-dependent oxidoreductase [Corynebacterium guangdongense]|uniref:Mercuric reductase n=1 Tax=Corynebacterium guangdongense TaxID=1783348 RepID=A0ABU2A041_9CORY|nr:FAD-dependent oxidoreductase [Corynebacterium guangdongense]MDR7330561.1 mercuric reductase [Corynebacterium guangdongense]WJZ19115.1 Mercuric reductase [Corynebacterium guangdongense]